MADGSLGPTADPHELIELATELRELGVAEFTWRDAHVKFQDGVAGARPAIETVKRDPAPKKEPVDVYHDPSLWGGGKPPTFPGSPAKDS